MSRSKTLSIVGAGCVILLVAVLTALSLPPDKVQATSKGDAGRYQISSWAAYSGEKVHHSGYYVLDTATGEVVDRGHEIHGIDSGGRR